MKILITTGIFPPDIGGPATYTYNLAKEFLKSGHDVSVVTYGKPNSIDGIEVHAVSRDVNIFVRYFKYFLKVWQVGKNFDLIFCFDVFSVGLPSVLVNLFLRKKIIMRLGGDFFWEKECNSGGKVSLSEYYRKKMYPRNFTFWLYSFVYRRLTYIIFSTEMQRDLHLKAFPHIKDKTGIVGNAFPNVDIEIASIYEKKNSFLTVGRLIKLKNFELLIRIFKQLHDEGYEVELDMYGKGPEEDNLKKLINDIGAESYVRLNNSLPHKELIEKIKNVYACILPSISEVSPNFGLECLKLGKPLIVTKETGFNNFFEGDSLRIDPFDEVDLKNAILKFINAVDYASICPKVKSRDLDRSWADVSGDFLKIVNEIL